MTLVLLSFLAAAGCRNPSDRGDVTKLVDRFMDIVASSDGAARSAELLEIFTGLDPSDTPSVLRGLAPASPDLSHAVRGVRFIPFDGAAVTVDIEGGGMSATLEMRARKVGGAWRLEPSFRVRQRLGEVKVPGG